MISLNRRAYEAVAFPVLSDLVSPFQGACAENSARYSANDGIESSSRLFQSCDNVFASIAQIRMRLASSNCCSMAPATRTLCIWRFRYRSACFCGLMDCQVTHNEEFFQFLLTDFLSNIGIRMQNNPGLQRVSNQFFLTRALDRLRDDAA